MTNSDVWARTAVALNVHGDGDEAIVRVDNDGPVVPFDRREDIFARFGRLDDSRVRDSGGSGLGLAIVRTVAEAHGGSVTATESAEGLCRFELRLPRQAPPNQP